MVEGLFGGPRPLLSRRCLLVVRDYNALPLPTVSGGMSPDYSAEFQQAARDQLPVEAISTEEHEQPDPFGDYLIAELETDRIQLNQFMSFVEAYADLLNVDDLRKIGVGIDARTAINSSVPRPFVDDDVTVFLLLEIRFPSEYGTGRIERVISQLEAELNWVADSTRTGSDTGILQHHSGVNDFVSTQALDLIEELEEYEIPVEDVTVTCAVIGE